MPKIVLRLERRVKGLLQKTRRKTVDKGLAIRCQIVLLRHRGHNASAIAQALGCSVSWVHRVLGRFRRDGFSGLMDRREHNGELKLDDPFLACLKQIVDQSPQDFGYHRPTWTQELLAKVMHQQTGVKVHPATISRALKQIQARWGRPRPTVGCPWSKRAKNRRLSMIRRSIRDLPASQAAVYLDEADIHLNPKIGPDWMNRGTQKQVPTPGQNVKRYLCGTYDATRRRLEYVVGPRKNGSLFIDMLQKLLKVYAGYEVIHVVLDNYRIHSSKQAQAWLAEHGRPLRLHFLPPYCPQENRIERQWLDLHANVTRNHRCQSIDELMQQVFGWVRRRNRSRARAAAKKAA